MDLLTIGQLSQRSGVAATALRYYDELGILTAVRLANAHRRYPVDALDRLQLIKLLKALGCTLAEIVAVLGPEGGEPRRSVAVRKLAELETTMARLAAARPVLTHFAECGHAAGQGEECRDAVRSAWSTVASAS